MVSVMDEWISSLSARGYKSLQLNMKQLMRARIVQITYRVKGSDS